MWWCGARDSADAKPTEPVSYTHLDVYKRQLVNLFATQANAEIIATGSKFLTIVSPFYFFVCIKIVIDGGVRGCGDVYKRQA